MKRVFISYASEERTLATEIALALKGEGYQIWSDFERLQPGDGFREEIAEGIAKSDCAVFVMCAHAVTDGSFVLTEMGHAQEKWPYPIGCILTVRLNDVAISAIPAYLREATLLEEKGTGNIPSEVVRAVGRLRPPTKWRKWVSAGAALVLMIAVAVWAWPDGDAVPTPDRPLSPGDRYQAQLELLARRARRPVPMADCNSDVSRSHAADVRNSDEIRAAFQFLRDSSSKLGPRANTSLDSTNLQGMVFKGLNLRGVSFDHACIDSSIFRDAQLEGATFNESSGEAADFTRAKLDSSSFSRARLPRATFLFACLRRSAFPGADLENAKFRYADLGWVSFFAARLADAEGWERGDSARSHGLFLNATGLTSDDSATLRASGAIFGGTDFAAWRDQRNSSQLSPSAVSACQALDTLAR